jgi:hypothetical protein
MPSKSWGTPLTITDHIVIGENEEIPSGKKVFVANQAIHEEDQVPAPQWEQFLTGDMQFVKNQIEQQIPGAKVIWLNCAWDSTVHEQGMFYNYYRVRGFRVEAICENTGTASLTGLEIISIIVAVAFIAVVVAVVAMGAWLVWRIEAAAEQIGPVATIGVGIGVLVLLLLFLFLMFGGKAEYRGKKRRVRLGK